MPSNNNLKYENSRTFRHHLRELCLRGLPRSMYKSPGEYDKILHMVRRWLNCCLHEEGCKAGMRHWFAMDGRDFDDNPLAVYMKTKEFKIKQMIVHFAILNLLNTDEYIPVSRLILGKPDEQRWKRYGEGEKGLAAAVCALKERTFYKFHLPNVEIEIDRKCIRETLNNYVKIGLLECRRNKNRDEYRIRKEAFALDQAKNYISFWAGLSPIELIGSIIKDRCVRKYGSIEESLFRFKYRYLHHILDAEVLEIVFDGIRGHHPIVVQMVCELAADALPHSLPDHFELKTIGRFSGHTTTVIPLKLYASVRTGRRYVMGLYKDSLELASIRLDRIEQAVLETDDNGCIICLSDDEYREAAGKFSEISAHLWGVSHHCNKNKLVHVSFDVHDSRPNAPKVKRLAKEKHCGTVTEIEPNHAHFEADVYDGRELFPWIRTYLGYLSNLSFSDDSLTDLFWKQVRVMKGKMSI